MSYILPYQRYWPINIHNYCFLEYKYLRKRIKPQNYTNKYQNKFVSWKWTNIRLYSIPSLLCCFWQLWVQASVQLLCLLCFEHCWLEQAGWTQRTLRAYWDMWSLAALSCSLEQADMWDTIQHCYELLSSENFWEWKWNWQHSVAKHIFKVMQRIILHFNVNFKITFKYIRLIEKSFKSGKKLYAFQWKAPNFWYVCQSGLSLLKLSILSWKKEKSLNKKR